MRFDVVGRLIGCTLGLIGMTAVGFVQAQTPPVAAPASADADGNGLRAATVERLAVLSEVERLAVLSDESPESSAGTLAPETRKALVDLLQARLKTLDALDRATATHQRAEHPASSPAQEKSALDAEFTRLQAEQKAPQPHLPEIFTAGQAQPVAARLNGMRDAIAAAKEALKETFDELESLRTETHPKTEGGQLFELKARREELHQKLEDLSNSKNSADVDASAATDSDARQIARETAANIGLEIRVENENLAALDATIAQESEHSLQADLRLQTQTLRVEIGRRRLHAMQAQYQALADQQRHALETAAGEADRRARRSKDPIEHFRAKRGAILLTLQAQLLSEEKELSATPRISSYEQERLTREARDDLENLRTLIEGGRSTTLVALRLTNSYRRISQQRETIVGHELATATAALTQYENLLTSVELDILNDSREDRQEYEALLAQLPVSRHALAQEVFEGLEDQHRELLESRRKVLTTLARHAETTRASILRRIGILDDQYAYIRTHIFWVRDAQPLGLATAGQCRLEGRTLLLAVGGLVGAHWEGDVAKIVSVEFVFAALFAIVLPVVFFRIRQLLCRRLAREYERHSAAMLPLN